MIVGYLIGAAAIIALYGTNTLVEAARPNLSAPNAVRALWVLQIISTSVPILAAAVIFANVIVK
ncbi:MAG: hypothetical protein JWQ79_1466, partial [Mucilaginibacter sp.]|nr:hypothetical protein [Mucilaginibacter sp.]